MGQRVFIRGFFAALFIFSTLFMPSKASAQSFWDSLFGEENSGRQLVRFPYHNFKPGTIVVSFSDRRLYFVYRRGEAISYPVAVPKGDAMWEGVNRVSAKKIDPDWTPTAQMRRENPQLPAFVPGGHPRNPLGRRALYLGSTLYRIHGTDAPWTIGTPVSHGCIRMYNDDVEDLYQRVPVGTPVVVTWQRFMTEG